jgi:hypothetical protein
MHSTEKDSKLGKYNHDITWKTRFIDIVGLILRRKGHPWIAGGVEQELQNVLAGESGRRTKASGAFMWKDGKRYGEIGAGLTGLTGASSIPRSRWAGRGQEHSGLEIIKLDVQECDKNGETDRKTQGNIQMMLWSK